MGKKLLFIVLLICTAHTTVQAARTKWFFSYRTTLKEVRVDNNIFQSADPEAYEDSIVSISIYNSSDRFFLHVKNNTSNVISIDWDKASYINHYQSAQRIIHSGVRFIEKEKAQEKTIIPPYAKINDAFIPADNIYYSQALPGTFGLITGQTYTGWNTRNIFPYYTKDITQRNEWVTNYIGRTYSVFIPLIVNDKQTIYYNLTYQINEIDVVQHNPDMEYSVKSIEDFPKGRKRK